MDTLYVGEIPKDYKYALFNNGYIDLYNQKILTNGSYNYYRIYTNVRGFYYKQGSQDYSTYYTTYATEIKTTDNICYRHDFSDICSITFFIFLLGLFLFNIMTSMVRKGGVLGGLV